MATAADIAARVLRRLGVAVVAIADRPDAGAPTLSAVEVGDRALRMLGVPVPQNISAGGYVAVADIARRALRMVGANPMGEQSQADGIVAADDLVTQVLQRLGVVAADETPSGPDFAAAASMFRAVHHELRADGLVSWDVNSIPERAAGHYVVLAANLLAPAFGRQADQDNYTRAREQIRLVALSGIYAQDRADQVVRNVHDGLASAGLAWWAPDAVPSGVADDYAAIAAQSLAPVYGRPPDPVAREAAETRIRRTATAYNARARATEAARRVHADVIAGGLAEWSADAIPAGAADAMAQMVAMSLAPEFGGKPSDPGARADAEMRLRRYIAGGPAGQALAERVVWTVHAELVARGVARWTIHDVPIYAEEPYVMLAAYRMAPDFAMQRDPTDMLLAEKMLSKVTALPSGGAPVRAVYF